MWPVASLGTVESAKPLQFLDNTVFLVLIDGKGADCASRRFAGRTRCFVDTLNDHVQAVQTASADLRRLRLCMVESCERKLINAISLREISRSLNVVKEAFPVYLPTKWYTGNL